MRSVIAYGLAYPERMQAGVGTLSLAEVGALEFYSPNLQKFACLGLAFDALKQGGNFMGALNAANEVAVDAFLHGRIGFLAIAHIIEQTLAQIKPYDVNSLAGILANDQAARRIANTWVAQTA